MSILPVLLNEFLNDELSRPSRLLDQHFGVDFFPEDLLEPMETYLPSVRNLLRSQNYYRPWRLTNRQDVGSTITDDREKYQISLDVQQFKPSEITVKTIDENCVVIEGKHEERQDEQGYISRQFRRRYVLPKGHDIKDVVSTLSSDGILTVTALKKQHGEDANERIIPISQTGPVKAVGSGDQKNADK